MISYRKILPSLSVRLFGIRPLETIELAGKPVTARYGTLRRTPDYDDAWLLACALRSRAVLDIGANLGQAALTILLAESVKHIVLVDPNPNALATAAENTIHNLHSRFASFICAFVSSSTGESLDFWTVGTGAAGSKYATHARTAAKHASHSLVPTITVDDLCRQLGFEPDLIKVDVEGAEYEVLEGSCRLALSGQRRFLVEMHSSIENPMPVNAENILKWCGQVNYRAWYLKEHVPFTAPQQISHRGRCHLLLQPASMDYPMWLKDIEQGSPLEQALI